MKVGYVVNFFVVSIVFNIEISKLSNKYVILFEIILLGVK